MTVEKVVDNKLEKVKVEEGTIGYLIDLRMCILS